MLINQVHTVVVHCSATKSNEDIGRDEIDLWHRQNGWWGIGYHHVIRRNGTIEIGRPLNMMGAHVKGNNYNTWGICMVGGLDLSKQPEDNFTLAQYESLQIMLYAYIGISGNIKQIMGHRDFSPDLNGDGIIDKSEWIKSCPCFEVKDKLFQWNITL